MTLKDKIKLLIPITRVEFIPANSASILIGFAWAIEKHYVFNFNTIGLLLSLFFVLSSVGTLGAHWNSYSDHELDSEDPTKKELHKSLSNLGKKQLKNIIIVEFGLAAVIFLLFWHQRGDLNLLGIWIAATFFAFNYSMPPMRFKAKNLLAFISLCLVLSILPIMFVFLSTNQSLNKEFVLFLIGHTLVVYSLIIPTEIRDYEVDMSHKISTMTVWLGLKKAIILAQNLIVVGTVFIITSYYRTELFNNNLFPSISLLFILGGNGFVFYKLNQLRKIIYLSDNTGNQNQEVSDFAKDNPKWITISSTGSMVVALITIVGKIFF